MARLLAWVLLGVVASGQHHMRHSAVRAMKRGQDGGGHDGSSHDSGGRSDSNSAAAGQAPSAALSMDDGPSAGRKRPHAWRRSQRRKSEQARQQLAAKLGVDPGAGSKGDSGGWSGGQSRGRGGMTIRSGGVAEGDDGESDVDLDANGGLLGVLESLCRSAEAAHPATPCRALEYGCGVRT